MGEDAPWPARHTAVSSPGLTLRNTTRRISRLKDVCVSIPPAHDWSFSSTKPQGPCCSPRGHPQCAEERSGRLSASLEALRGRLRVPHGLIFVHGLKCGVAVAGGAHPEYADRAEAAGATAGNAYDPPQGAEFSVLQYECGRAHRASCLQDAVAAGDDDGAKDDVDGRVPAASDGDMRRFGTLGSPCAHKSMEIYEPILMGCGLTVSGKDAKRANRRYSIFGK